MVRHKKPKSRLHRALGLHPHKHTGKLLAHRHTSYRVLFALMLATAGMMTVVSQLDALADNIAVSARVPAPMPSGSPTIDSPVAGYTTKLSQVTVSGTCPIISPAIIVAIYDGGALVGSVQCSVTGDYSVPITLDVGSNPLIATVVTITGEHGNTSPTVTVFMQGPTPPPKPVPSTNPGGTYRPTSTPTPSIPPQEILIPTFRIIPVDPFVSIDSNGKVTWAGSIQGGTTPYTVTADWGDGTVDRRTVHDHAQITFTHVYKIPRVYALLVKAVDVNGVETILYSTAISASVVKGNPPDATKTPTVLPVVSFVSDNAPYIYIGTLASLVFLWYLEHGRRIIAARKIIGGQHRQ